MWDFVFVGFAILLILNMELIMLLLWLILYVGFFIVITESFKLPCYTWTMRFVINFSWLNAINLTMIKKILNPLPTLLIIKHLCGLFLINLFKVTLLKIIHYRCLSLQRLCLTRLLFCWLWWNTSSHSSNYSFK